MTEKQPLPEDVLVYVKQRMNFQKQTENDLTVTQLAEEQGCSKTHARVILKRLAKEGSLIEVEGTLLNGGWGKFYRMAKKNGVNTEDFTPPQRQS